MYILPAFTKITQINVKELEMENTEFTTQFATNQTPNTDGDQDTNTLIMFKYQLYTHFVIIPIGMVLNFLCFYIFLKSGLYKSATGIHLTYLAIADNVVLISELFTDSSNTARLFAPALYNNGLFSCEWTYFTMLAGFLWSGILLTSATFERFLSVAYPLKIKMWNLYHKSKILMVIYLVLSFSLYSFSLLCLESISSETGSYQCLPVVKYINICRYGDIIISTVLSNCLCSFMIFIFTILTSIKLYDLAQKRSQLSKDGDSGKEFQISLMLVTVATLFLVLRLPEIITFQLVSFFAGNNFQTSVSKTLVQVYPILFIPVTLNHTVNFFIYLVFLQRFRQTFMDLLPSRLWKNLRNVTGSVTGTESGTGIVTGSVTGTGSWTVTGNDTGSGTVVTCSNW